MMRFDKKKPKMILSFLAKIDKAFYFPTFLALTAPLVFFAYNWIITYFYILGVSFLHFFLLKIYPYINDSNYYRYQVLSKEYFMKHEIYTPILNKKNYFSIFFILWVGVYAVSVVPGIASLLFPIQLVVVGYFISNNSIELYNIIHRPPLPETIYKLHPLFQNGYSPWIDFVLHKAIPFCIRIFFSLFAGYTVLCFSWKILYGWSAIDPMRNYVCNKFHGFPQIHQWTENGLFSWSAFLQTDAAKSIPYDVAVRKFLQNEDEIIKQYVSRDFK